MTVIIYKQERRRHRMFRDLEIEICGDHLLVLPSFTHCWWLGHFGQRRLLAAVLGGDVTSKIPAARATLPPSDCCSCPRLTIVTHPRLHTASVLCEVFFTSVVVNQSCSCSYLIKSWILCNLLWSITQKLGVPLVKMTFLCLAHFCLVSNWFFNPSTNKYVCGF